MASVSEKNGNSVSGGKPERGGLTGSGTGLEPKPIRVSVIDDDPMICQAMSLILNDYSHGRIEVVSTSTDGETCVRRAAEEKPDVVLMDIAMPGVDGIEATRRITALESEAAEGTRPTRVIILTTFDLDEYVMAAINAGASGFLLKDTEPETLLNSIRTVFQGNAIIAPSATKRLIEKMMQDGYAQHGSLTGDVARSGAVYGSAVGVSGGAAGNGAGSMTGIPSPAGAASDGSNTSRPAYTDPELDLLTDREREVLVEIAHGLSNQEIADKLFISLPTVKTHVAHILAKINARDRVQAVVFAYDNGLV